MGDPDKVPSEEDSDRADEKRSEAQRQLGEGNIQEAINLFTEAIKLNPTSAVLFVKRGQCFLKLNKPNACIKVRLYSRNTRLAYIVEHCVNDV